MNSDIVLATPITRAVRAEIAYLGGVVPWATMLLPALRVEQLPAVSLIERSMLEIQASSAIGRPVLSTSSMVAARARPQPYPLPMRY